MRLYGTDGKEYKDYSFILSAITNVICIGDSVTAGVGSASTGEEARKYSYPTRLAKMTDWTIENAGFGGITALGWWQNKFANYDFTQYQLAIIELGYNEGLTDTLDTDCVGNDYTAYADTNTGAYCKIIEGIKAVNPNMIIILIISSAMQTSGDTYKVIGDIGAKYSLPVINLTDPIYIDLNVPEYHDNAGDYVHFNALGYIAKAKYIHADLTDYFINNQSVLTTEIITSKNTTSNE